jgi:hypothetical protein
MVQQQGQKPRHICYSPSGLLSNPYHNELQYNQAGQLVGTNQTRTIWFYSNIKQIADVSLVE